MEEVKAQKQLKTVNNQGIQIIEGKLLAWQPGKEEDTQVECDYAVFLSYDYSFFYASNMRATKLKDAVCKPLKDNERLRKSSGVVFFTFNVIERPKLSI